VSEFSFIEVIVGAKKLTGQPGRKENAPVNGSEWRRCVAACNLKVTSEG